MRGRRPPESAGRLVLFPEPIPGGHDRIARRSVCRLYGENIRHQPP